ncbi:MAG: DUF1638 domain-containing protein [bacterium]
MSELPEKEPAGEKAERASPEGPKWVIACGSVKPEIEALHPEQHGIMVRFLDQNLHRTPDLMPEFIQEAVDAVKAEASMIVLGYGLCSNGIAGVKAPDQGLIVPRIHDCIALFLGSREKYQKAFSDNAGTYYLSPGWVAEKKDPLGYLESDYVPRVGRETAEWALREELKHYTRIALINTGVQDVGPLRERARENAGFLEKDYFEVEGTDEYFKKILFGPYNEEDFIHIRPGEVITQMPFLE